MTDANQIRINELARDLEVKAKAIIDYLPEAGVTEKKTHSSSIDLAAAEKVRKHFQDMANAEAAAEARVEAEKTAREAAAKAARLRPTVAAPPPPPPPPPPFCSSCSPSPPPRVRPAAASTAQARDPAPCRNCGGQACAAGRQRA